MMSHFGLCAGLYLVKNTVKCPEKTAFLGCVADVFDAMLNYIFSFLLGHAALRLCWPYLKLMLSKNSIDVGLLLRPLESMLGDVEPPWSMLARSWDHVGLCCWLHSPDAGPC